MPTHIVHFHSSIYTACPELHFLLQVHISPDLAQLEEKNKSLPVDAGTAVSVLPETWEQRTRQCSRYTLRTAQGAHQIVCWKSSGRLDTATGRRLSQTSARSQELSLSVFGFVELLLSQLLRRSTDALHMAMISIRSWEVSELILYYSRFRATNLISWVVFHGVYRSTRLCSASKIPLPTLKQLEL